MAQAPVVQGQPRPAPQASAPGRRDPLLVSDVALKRETAACYLDETLLDACDSLGASGRSAALLVDTENQVRGVITENDILQAFTSHVPHELTMDQWLECSQARLPRFLMPSLTMSPTNTLFEAASCMAAMAQDPEARSFRFACHHLLVRIEPKHNEPEFDRLAGEPGHEGVKLRLLSALDIALGITSAASNENEAISAATLSVQQVMKPRSKVPACRVTDSLIEAFLKIQSVQQNCALVMTGHSGGEGGGAKQGSARGLLEADAASEETAQEKENTKNDEELSGDAELDQQTSDSSSSQGLEVCGAITTADVMRAFSEHHACKEVTLGGWLRGLAQSPARRAIAADAPLSEAANTMADFGVHHLLAKDPVNGEVVGVLSALDIVCAVGKKYTQELDAHPASVRAGEGSKQGQPVSAQVVEAPQTA